MSAPDGSHLSVRTFRILDWSRHKAQLRAAFMHLNKVYEDSDHRFWFEIGNEHRTTHYIAVRDGMRVCSGLLEIRATGMRTAEGIVNRIVTSLGPAGVP